VTTSASGAPATEVLSDANGDAQWNGGDTITGAGVADLPLAGDWNGDGIDHVGYWRPSTRKFTRIPMAMTQERRGRRRHRHNPSASPPPPLTGDWSSTAPRHRRLAAQQRKPFLTPMVTIFGAARPGRFELNVRSGSLVAGKIPRASATDGAGNPRKREPLPPALAPAAPAPALLLASAPAGDLQMGPSLCW
jgi:hypothetical protein